MVPLFLFHATASLAQTSIVIIDTGFCSGIKEFDATNSLGDYCKSASKDRLHGKRVYETFMSNLSDKKNVNIIGVTVFDEKGNQKIEYWDKALKYIESVNPDLVISSVALPLKKSINPFPNYKRLSFFAAPRKQRRIKSNTIFWPHHWKKQNMFFVSGLKNGKRDLKEMYSSDVDFRYEGSSSLSNAVLAAESLNQCESKKEVAFLKCINGKIRK